MGDADTVSGGNRILIRPAASGDADAVRDCAEAAYSLYILSMDRKPAPMVADFVSQIRAGHVHVGIDGSGLAGFIVMYPRGDHIHVENVAVRPERQGMGIGRRLLASAEERALAAGIGAIELCTNAAMTENLAFYPRLGYREINRRREAAFERVYFRKLLSG